MILFDSEAKVILARNKAQPPACPYCQSKMALKVQAHKGNGKVTAHFVCTEPSCKACGPVLEPMQMLVGGQLHPWDYRDLVAATTPYKEQD